MTDHRRFLALVAASIDFELTAAEHDLLAAHMATCRACRLEADAFRRDAVAIAAFPQAQLAPDVAAAILERVLRRPARNYAIAKVLLAALLASLAIAAAAVGAGLIREWRDGLLVVPPPPPFLETAIASASPSPDPTPSTTTPIASASPSLAPSPSNVAAATWTVSSEASVDPKLGQPRAVAAGPDLMVALGGLGCTTDSDGNGRCWAQTVRSVDGATWTAIPSTDATEVGSGPAIDGPTIGMNDIAAGTDDFVAIGYVAFDQMRAAVWHATDGTDWERIADDAVFDEAHLRTVAHTPHGWIIGGAVAEPDGPRAAAWYSPDGRTWQRATDSPAMDVGGYIGTLKYPVAGGIRDVATRGAMIIAVGSSCDAQGTGCMPAVWSSLDGRTWDRQADIAASPGDLNLVVAADVGFVAIRRECSDTCGTGVLISPDGTVWREASMDGFPERAEPRAMATVAGTIAVSAVEDGRLKIVASTDGRSWSTVREVAWPGDDPASASPDAIDVFGLGMATRPDGSAVVVGWANIQPSEGDGVQETFHFEVRRP
jgi:hypothetical protein